MIYAVCFSMAVLLLLLGHFFRMLRWKQFVSIYEKTNNGMLLSSLMVGYSINFFVPFRVGDIVRAVISGKKLKNGIAFSLSTIIVEHFMDIPVVCAVFVVMDLLNMGGTDTHNGAVLYLCLTAVMLVAGAIVIRFSGVIKSIAKSVCSIFNHTIEYGLLFFLWSLIMSFKNIFKKLDKVKLGLYTICMWVIYLVSYFFLYQAMLDKDVKVQFSDVFTALFSQGGFSTAGGRFSWTELTGSNHLLSHMVAYIAISLILLFVITMIVNLVKGEEETQDEEKIVHLLPWVKQEDSLNFLEEYFSTGNAEQLKKYVNFNKDIYIIQDFSAGSNATTMLCMDEDQTFYRKYALGKDGDKLYEQIEWLHEHDGVIPLPVILNEQHIDGYCIYDMEYNANAVGLFNCIHSTSTEKSWAVLEQALNCLKENLHVRNVRPADKELTKKYIEDKVIKNVEKIEAAKEIKPLIEYDTLLINGVEYKNLKQLKKWLSAEYLNEVFAKDEYADVHGDLTVENIVCFDRDPKVPYYFIDPNTGNLHESPALDYAKLLQSLHGNYEFLMRTAKVEVKRNEITFISSGSKHYSDIYKKYDAYLNETFTKEQVRSIYFHEVIHWLRLMPYKIEKDGARAVLFYAGLIKVFNETVERFAK